MESFPTISHAYSNRQLRSPPGMITPAAMAVGERKLGSWLTITVTSKHARALHTRCLCLCATIDSKELNNRFNF
jgi:hypothetical protein